MAAPRLDLPLVFPLCRSAHGPTSRRRAPRRAALPGWQLYPPPSKEGALRPKHTRCLAAPKPCQPPFPTTTILLPTPAAVDLNSNHTVERSEFRDLILHMAAADLHSRKEEHRQLEASAAGRARGRGLGEHSRRRKCCRGSTARAITVLCHAHARTDFDNTALLHTRVYITRLCRWT